jgi:hypothetical protein
MSDKKDSIKSITSSGSAISSVFVSFRLLIAIAVRVSVPVTIIERGNYSKYDEDGQVVVGIVRMPLQFGETAMT